MTCPCYYCGQSPSDHHGRCCHHKQHDFPDSVWTTSGTPARGSVGDNAVVPKAPPPVLQVADRLDRVADRAYYFAKQELARQTVAEEAHHFSIATPTEAESVTPRTNQRLKTLEDDNALVKAQLAASQKQCAEMHSLLKQATEALKQHGLGHGIQRAPPPDVLSPAPPPPPVPPPPTAPPKATSPPVQEPSSSSSSGLTTGGNVPATIPGCTLEAFNNRTNPPGTYPTLAEIDQGFTTEQGTQVSVADSVGSVNLSEWKKVQYEDY